MQATKGNEIKYCPFRIKRESDLSMPNTFYENFMPCLKEDCICYDKYISFDKKYVNEYCSRDNISFCRQEWNEESEEQND